MKLVSIIIPCFNSELFLDETIQSLLNQNYANCEYIFVNDGSADKTKEIIEHYVKKDARVILVNKDNGGVSSARNVGLKHSHGELIMFCDSDDLIYRDTVEILVNCMNDTGADVCFGKYCTFKSNPSLENERKSFSVKRINRFEMQKELSKCDKIQNHLWGKMFKASAIKNYVFNENFHIWEDIREMYHLIDMCDKGAFLNTDVTLYRQSNNSLSSKLDIEKLNEFCVAQIDKAQFYLTKYPNLAKFHCESMFQCAAEIIGRRFENKVLSFRDFLTTYDAVSKKAHLLSKIKHFIIRHERLYRIIFGKK